MCKKLLVTDDLQPGFKSTVGCTDAISALKTAIKNFNSNDGSVYCAALHIRKAFDRSNRYKLFNSLIYAGVPIATVNVMCNWYSKLTAQDAGMDAYLKLFKYVVEFD